MSKKISNNYTLETEKKYSAYSSFICIPITAEKKPVVSWKSIVKTPEDKFLPEHNIAILCGKINQITVIDIDNPKIGKSESDGMKLYEELLEKYNQGNDMNTPICITQSGGLHIYFAYDPEVLTTTGVNGYSIDIRNDGGLIIAPPSIGKMGPYLWKNNKSLSDIAPMIIPQWFKDWLKLSSDKQKIVKDPIIKIDTYVANSEIRFIYKQSDIYNLLNTLPSKYYNNYSDWLVITSCLKSENLKDIWNRWSEKSIKYNESNNNNIWLSLIPELNIWYLVVLCQKEKIFINHSIIHKTKRIDYLTKNPDIQINKQYMHQLYFNKIRTQIIKSNCGTGKTTMSTQYIKELINGKGYKILSLTVRVSLAFQQKKNFKDNGIDISVYKDIILDEYNQLDKLIIQIDSIGKLDPKYWKNTILYLDEISALFTYILTSTTLKDKRVNIINMLINLMRNASYILCTDADINDMVLCFFDKLKISYYLIENTYKNINNTMAIEYEDKQIIINKMQELLLDGKKLICCFDSKQEMDLTVQRLKTFCESNDLKKQSNNFLIYSSTEGDETDFLQINDKWKNKNIFFTPKITIGVSFDNKVKRDVFLIARGNSINAFGYVQQISRCRNINSLHYYVIKKYQKLKFDSPSDVSEHYKNLLQDFNYIQIKSNDNTDELNADISDNLKLKEIKDNCGAFLDYQTNKWEYHDTIFNELFFISEYYDHVLRSAPREQLRWMLEDKGYMIQYNSETIDSDILPEVKKEITESKEIIVDNLEQMNHRALYDSEASLTESEKKIRENAIRRAKYMNIKFTKINKEKYSDYLVDDVKFTNFCTYKLLMESDDKLDDKLAKQLEKDYLISNTKSIITKVKLIKQLEDLLGIKFLEIDTNKYVERFDEKILIKKQLKNSIKNVFRSSRDIDDNCFKNWYYQLIQMYKNVSDINIFNRKLKRYQNIRYWMYILNQNIISQYNDILKSKKSTIATKILLIK
jgi:hypothetical protein